MEIFIIRDGKQTGPYDEDAVHDMLTQGSVLAKDKGWRKGLSGWMPLSEVLKPDVGETDPAAGTSGSAGRGTNGSSMARTPATAKQKALLRYLGLQSIDGVGKEEAAVAISDALENPKFQARITKWGEEKLRLHPDVFQDEIDFRTANRTSRYLDLCQTEGAEVVKDVTKAHVQVLVESLDKRFPSWESEHRAALWDYLFPSIAEHFPTLVLPAAKGKLRLGGVPKMVAALARKPTVGLVRTPVPPPAPGVLSAALRGIVFGLVLLGIIAGGMKFWPNATRPAAPQTPPPATSASPAGTPKESVPPKQAESPVVVAKAPEIGPGLLPDIPPAAAPARGPAPAEPAPAPPAPAAAPAMAENKPPAMEAKMEAKPDVPTAPVPAEAPAPATAPLPPLPAPVAPAAPAAPRTSVTLIQGISVALPNGQITLPAGTQLRYLALEGQNVRVAWNNNLFYVPAIATDVNNLVAAPATPPAAPAIPATSGVRPAVPGAPATPRKPGDDL